MCLHIESTFLPPAACPVQCCSTDEESSLQVCMETNTSRSVNLLCPLKCSVVSPTDPYCVNLNSTKMHMHCKVQCGGVTKTRKISIFLQLFQVSFEDETETDWLPRTTALGSGCSRFSKFTSMHSGLQCTNVFVPSDTIHFNRLLCNAAV